jgi:hypothetical protein
MTSLLAPLAIVSRWKQRLPADRDSGLTCRECSGRPHRSRGAKDTAPPVPWLTDQRARAGGVKITRRCPSQERLSAIGPPHDRLTCFDEEFYPRLLCAEPIDLRMVRHMVRPILSRPKSTFSVLPVRTTRLNYNRCHSWRYSTHCISQPVAQRLPVELWWGRVLPMSAFRLPSGATAP